MAQSVRLGRRKDERRIGNTGRHDGGKLAELARAEASYEKLLYNESIKSLSLIRNSARVRASGGEQEGAERGRMVSPPVHRFSSFCSCYLLLPRTVVRVFPICLASELGAPRVRFVSRASRNAGQVLDTHPTRRDARERALRDTPGDTRAVGRN